MNAVAHQKSKWEDKREKREKRKNKYKKINYITINVGEGEKIVCKSEEYDILQEIMNIEKGKKERIMRFKRN